MMPIGTPRVPYRTPGEGTWQWVDLWNALVRYDNLYLDGILLGFFHHEVYNVLHFAVPGTSHLYWATYR